MSGRKVSEAKLQRQARKALEEACRACRKLADETCKISRQAGRAKALVAMDLKQARQQVGLAVESWDKAVGAYDSSLQGIEGKMRRIMQLGRSPADRRLAAHEAEQLRQSVQQQVKDLGRKAGRLQEIADKIGKVLPTAMDKQALQWSEEQRELQGLQQEIRRRRERGEFDRQVQALTSLVQEIDKATASPKVLPADVLPGLRSRMKTLIEASWQGEIEHQERLETGDRLARALSDCKYRLTGRVNGRTIILTGETAEESISANIAPDGKVTWDMVSNAKGTAAPGCKQRVEKIIAKARDHGVDLTGFHMVEGREVAEQKKAQKQAAPSKTKRKAMARELP